MGNWLVYGKKCDFKGIGERLGVDQVIVRILRNRDMTQEQEMRRFLFPSEECVHDYSLLKDLDNAVDITLNKIDEDAHIRIIGDYDVDGIMSTYILKKGLSLCGATVDYAIPHRIKDGYGISAGLIDEAYGAGIDTIITCDNGIAAVEAFEHAKELGMTCIVTDHHDIPYEESDGERREKLPGVEAIVDPKREGDMYPYKCICGAMVAYKFIECMFDACGIELEYLEEFKELAGFATVCDVMELRDENRYFVKYTLASLHNSHNVGMRALVRACELDGRPINSHSIGFVLGPCINATGRLESAGLSMELLMSETAEKAIGIAYELKELNETRKKLTEDGLDRAIYLIENEYSPEDKVIVAYLPGLHESLAGIVAGRIKERYYRPAFVVTKGKDGLKGSARSIEGYQIYDAMTEVKDVFEKYGGHAMAAGFSLKEGRLDEFRQRINENCRLTKEELVQKTVIDVPMPPEYVTEKLLEELSLLEPFGNGNEKPVFAQKNITFTKGRTMGKTGEMARFSVVTENGFSTEMVLFRRLDSFMKCIDDKYGAGAANRLFEGVESFKMDVIYYPSINEFRGKKSIQFIINDFA